MDLIKNWSDKFQAAQTGTGQSGSIHDEQAVKFVKKYFYPDQWVLDTLTQGLRLPFKGNAPTSYYEPNNASALKHMDYIREKVYEWEKLGRIKKLSNKPNIVNPLTVVEKWDSATERIKLRLVIDHSRCINTLLPDVPTKMDDLSVFEPLIQKDMYLASFDLDSMFHQVKLHPDYSQYFAFQITNKKGEPEYFKFLVLQFGNKFAVYAVTRLLRPLKSFAHSLGIKLVIFVDDGGLGAQSEELAKAQFKFVISLLQYSGWQIQWTKTSAIVSQTLNYQGFIIDTVKMKYFCPEQKLDFIKHQIKYALNQAKQTEPVAARHMASILGK